MSTPFWGNPGDRDGLKGPWNTIKLDGKVFPGADGYDDPEKVGDSLESIGGALGAAAAAGLGLSLGSRPQALFRPHPCVVTVHGAESAYRSDKFSDATRNKHSTTGKGPKPSSFDLKVHIWTAEQLASYEAYLPKIDPCLKTNKEKAHTIEHPDLALLNISSCYIERIGQLEDGPVPGLRIATIKCWKIFAGDGKGVGKPIKIDGDFSGVDALPPFVIPARPNG